MSNTLSEWTTFAIGGTARAVNIALSRGMLIDGAGTLVLGRGSNVLVSDRGYDGIVTVNRYDGIRHKGSTVTVGSGARLSVLCGYLAENGLSGLEWACGIPGSVGGAVKMNAGAFGGEISDSLVEVELLRGEQVRSAPKSELGFGYRASGITDDDIVISATFALERDDGTAIKSRMRAYNALRRNAQPSGRSAGSIFKNPKGVSVGRVFDECGLKGLRRGGAEISQVHANVIVNVGGATAKDVTALIGIMRAELVSRDIPAQEEIIYIGEF